MGEFMGERSGWRGRGWLVGVRGGGSGGNGGREESRMLVVIVRESEKGRIVVDGVGSLCRRICSRDLGVMCSEDQIRSRSPSLSTQGRK